MVRSPVVAVRRYAAAPPDEGETFRGDRPLTRRSGVLRVPHCHGAPRYCRRHGVSARHRTAGRNRTRTADRHRTANRTRTADYHRRTGVSRTVSQPPRTVPQLPCTAPRLVLPNRLRCSSPLRSDVRYSSLARLADHEGPPARAKMTVTPAVAGEPRRNDVSRTRSRFTRPNATNAQ